MIVIGLTGSIGMGKSTALAVFADLGLPVWDADAAVHRLYGQGGAGVAPIRALVPDAVTPNAVGSDTVDRVKLRAAILADPTLLKRIESTIHPLVAADRDAFLGKARASGAALAICDIPLLYETGADAWLDKVVVVSAPPDIQRARVLKRPGMTAEAFDGILEKQIPDTEKRARADHIIDTGRVKDHARAQVAAIVAELSRG